MNHRGLRTAAAALCAAILAGCARQQPVTMAPPMGGGGPMGSVASAPPVPGGGQNNIYNWQDVPVNQQVPVNRAAFDQGGYQIYAASGETIVVPFVNQNLYV